jgi:hypothetical protein
MKKIALIAAAALLCLGLAIPGTVYAQSGEWQISYYPNLDWSGSPVLVQTVSGPNLNWNSGSPGPGVPAENFTALLSASIAFNPGVYQFSVLADDAALLQIDGSSVLDTTGQGLSGQTETIDVAMTGGTHQFLVYYRQYTQADYINMNWTLLPETGPAPTTLPETGGASQEPASANSVVTPFGNYTRCIQQNLPQAACFVPNAENSPNVGSISMEPNIQIWGNCTADQVMTFLVPPNNTPQQFKCSKTEAGWFPD